MTRTWLEDEEGREVELPESGKAVLGCAGGGASVVLEGEGIDDLHCAIGRTREGQLAVKDLGSSSGTFVDGARVDVATLPAGSTLRIGSRSLRVVSASTPAADSAPAPGAQADATEDESRRIAGFRIERRLGQGGMGEVLLAVQESLHRPVALKVLSARLAADRSFVQRFQSEARAAAALSHPNVVVVYDVGESGGSHYLAMEYMPGGNLEERIEREGRLPWRDVLSILRDAATGLAFAEEQGILHRDIKPANLMVSAAGTVKIADLGLATSIDAQDIEGKAYGTPHFVSPEQARGEALDGRSDLYSLGATAFRLLTGRTPFQGRNAREIVRARFTEDPPRASDLVPTIPEPVSDLIERLLARDPAERPRSAAHLLEELDHLEAELAAPLPAKRRRPLLLLTLLVLAVSTGAWFVLRGGGSGSPADSGSPGGSRTAASVAAGSDADMDLANDEGFFGGAQDATGTDEEAALRERERQARAALERIDAGYSIEDRIDALEGVATRFRGTEAASEAETQLASLRRQLEDARASAARRRRDIDQTLDRIVAGSGWADAWVSSDEAPRLADAVEWIRGYQVGTALMTDPEFLAARSERIGALVEGVLTKARELKARADQQLAAGQFVEGRASLEPLARGFGLGDPALTDPPGFEELRALRDAARRRLDGIEEEAIRFRLALYRADRRRLATVLGPSSPLLPELERLELTATMERLDELTSLETQEVREVRDACLSDLRRAQGALSLLGSSFQEGAWRRRIVAVPAGRRTSSREVVGVRPGGLLLAADGQAEYLEFGAFREAPDALAGLFRNRLSRSLTGEEVAAVTTLLTLAGVANGARIAAVALDADAGAILSPADEDALPAAFGAALAWADENATGSPAEAAVRATVERERRVARLLAEALHAAAEESWTQATADLAFLLEEFPDAWLVLALSDGRDPSPILPVPAAR